MKASTRREFLASALSAASLPLLAESASAQETTRTGLRPLEGARYEYAMNAEMWYWKLPFPDRIRAAADAGFKWVEFWPWRGKDLDAIETACRETGVRISQFTAWGFSPGMNGPNNHDAFEKEIIASCKIANRLGAPMMTVVGGNDQPNMTQSEMHQHITTALKRVAPIAESHDVMLILEPMNIRVDHPGHCLYGSTDAVRICREVGSTHVKINWDLYHMQISEGDLCGRLRDGFDQVGYLQLADHPGRHEPGTGEIYYPRVLKEAFDLGYRGPIGCECSPADGESAAIERLMKIG